jgi:hypothetical protein
MPSNLEFNLVTNLKKPAIYLMAGFFLSKILRTGVKNEREPPSSLST